MSADKCRKLPHAHTLVDTSVTPRSEGDGGVMSDTNEQEPQWYSAC